MDQLRRIAGPLCVVTGVLIALTTTVGRFVSDPENLAETSNEPAAVINGVVALIAAVLLVFVVIALYAQRGDGGGRLRAVAFTLTLAGTVFSCRGLLVRGVHGALPCRRRAGRARREAEWHVARRCRGVIRRSQLVQTLLPLVIGLPLAGAAGLLAGQGYLRVLAPGELAVRMAGLVIFAALLTGVALTLLTLPIVSRRVSAELLRRE